MIEDSRQLALQALRAIHRGGFADIEVDRVLRQAQIREADRRLFTELVYGTVRRQRTLDALIDQLATKPAQQQPPDLRLLLHLGLYQLRYLDHIPASAAVNTTVELAKHQRLKGLTGFLNGLLRQYSRLSAQGVDPLQLPDDPIARIGVKHSFPDWIVQVWYDQLGEDETEQLCDWLNRPPAIDLRVNVLRAQLEQVEAALQSREIGTTRLPGLPQALRLLGPAGAIPQLPGYAEGWWMVQDSSAQLVSYLVAPQPGEVVVDACAAPGGKSMHLAELMQDQGKVWACDRSEGRLKKLLANASRLQLQSIQTCAGDSRALTQFQGQADRVLLDAPCSGLGTLHRHADARWRQTPATVTELATLQTELLQQTATWVKPGGVLVYSTCTLHPLENETVIQQFLQHHPDWQIDRSIADLIRVPGLSASGWLKVWPHRQQMDGFFMVRLRRIPD